MIAAVALTVATTLAPGPGPGLVDAVRMASVVRWNDTVTWNTAVEANAARARRLRPARVPAGSSTPDPRLEAIRWCESSGDYTAVSPGGRYRGGYQFDRATWTTVGGTGDPAAASPAEQDRRAQILYSERGSSPWPVCGAR